MPAKGAPLGILLVAILAGVRFLSGVSSEMVPQVAGLFEHCPASGELAFKDTLVSI